MFHFLLPLPQQLHNIAWLGDLGEIDLRLDLRLRGFFPGGRAGLGGEMLPDSFRFVNFYRA